MGVGFGVRNVKSVIKVLADVLVFVVVGMRGIVEGRIMVILYILHVPRQGTYVICARGGCVPRCECMTLSGLEPRLILTPCRSSNPSQNRRKQVPELGAVIVAGD